MSKGTKIQWADNTFNPWIGCTKVSAGCAHCYAENITRARVLRSRGHETWGKGAQRSRTSAATWKTPLRWNSEVEVHPDYRTKVFPSLCDWLDDEVPIEWLWDFLKLIYDTPHLDWLLLTKRPENWRERIKLAFFRATSNHPFEKWLFNWRGGREAPHNIWLGVSVENQLMADKRIPELLKIPAEVRFLSVEPMLGPIDLNVAAFDGSESFSAMGGIGWVIFGGESGPNARPCNIDWIRDGVRQCRIAGSAPFVKQLGSNIAPLRVENGSVKERLWLKDKKGGDIAEFPDDIKVREFPK